MERIWVHFHEIIVKEQIIIQYCNVEIVCSM